MTGKKTGYFSAVSYTHLMTREEREEALKYAKHYTMCFVYFLQHELGLSLIHIYIPDRFPV